MSASPVLFRCLLAIVALAPLPLAAHRPWAWSLLAILVGALLLAWSVWLLRQRRAAPVSLARLWPVAVPFGLVLVWAMAQTWPGLPADWHHPLWREAAEVLGSGAMTGSISLDPAATWTAILRLATYGGIFFLAVQMGRDRHLARQGLLTVAIATVVYAVYGLAVYATGNDRILWLEKWAYVDDLTATFVNRNAFGAYAGAGLICCIALFAKAVRRATENRLYDLAEDMASRAIPLLAAAMVVGMALLLSHSRGALVATAAGVAVLLAALGGGRVLSRRMTLMAAGLLVVTAVATIIISDGGTLQRLLVLDAESGGRQALYELVLRAIGDAPWTGFGLGTFRSAFHLYRDAPLLDPVVYAHAHDVHLELLMDLGVPGAALVYVAFAAILVTCVRGLFRRRRDHVHPAVAIATATLFGVHGLMDFSVQIPANAVLLAYLLGTGYAQSWSTDRRAAVTGGRTPKASADGHTAPARPGSDLPAHP